MLSTSLLKGMFWCSFVSREKSKDKQIVATVQKRKWKQIDVPVLGLAGCHWRGNWNGVAGTSPGVPGDILGSYEELRWMEPHMSSPSPCKRKIIRNEEVLHLFRCYTHTPTHTHSGVMVSGNCEWCHRRRLMSWVTCHRKQVENVTFEAVTSGKSKFQTVEKYLNSLTRTACSTV